MFDFTHPWYRPLYRRVGVVAICALWFGMELYMNGAFFMVLAGAATALTAWHLLLRFPAPPKE